MSIDEDYYASSNVKEYARRYETPYHLEKPENESINSIKKTIERGYKDKGQAGEHFRYLEMLENKLTNIYIEEQKYGIVNESLPGTISEVRELLAKVRSVISSGD